MSQSRKGQYVNSNFNGVLSSQKAGSGYSQPYTQAPRYGTGLVSLGSAKKARLPASSSASKLAVPKPVNLPSLRKENAGNDPNTQIVPSGGGTKWQKVEEPQPASADPRQTALTAGSTWASTQGRDSGWQPPAPPFQTLPPPRPGPRRLNPHEYPSLSAAAAARQQNLPRQPVPSLPDGQGSSWARSFQHLMALDWVMAQNVANWDEDERRLPVALPLHPAGDRSEDDVGFRPPWDDRGAGLHGRIPPDSAYGGGRPSDEERWVPGGAMRAGPYGVPPPPQRPMYARGPPGPPPARFGSQDRFAATDFPPFADDATLFPPPPVPARPPPPPPRREAQGEHEEAAGGGGSIDPEREAFLAELDRVAREKDEERRCKQELAETPAKEEPLPEAPVPAPPDRPSAPLTLAQVAAANVAEAEAASDTTLTPQNARLARRQREQEEEEMERKRKEAAAAKLKALDEAIAAREAERRAQEELAKKAEAEKEAEEAARLAKEAAKEAAAAAERAEAEEAARKLAGQAERAPATFISETEAVAAAGAEAELEGSVHGSSVDVQANSSVAQDALSDEDGVASVGRGAPEAEAPVPNAWKKSLLPNGGPAAAAAAGWPAKPTAAATASPGAAAPRSRATGRPQKDQAQKGSSHLPPVGTPVAAKPAALPMVEAKASEEPRAAAAAQQEPIEVPPAASAAPAQPKGPPMSWRKVLAGEDAPEPIPETAEAREPKRAEGGRGARGGRGRDREHRNRAERDGAQAVRDAPAGKEAEGRGRGRSRGRGERAPRAPGRKAEPSSVESPPSAAAAAEGAPAAELAGKRGRQRNAEARGGRGGRDSAAERSRGQGRGARAATARGQAAVPAAGPPSAPSTPTAVAAAAVAEPPPPAAERPAASPAEAAPSMPPGLGWEAAAPELPGPPGLGWGALIGGSLGSLGREEQHALAGTSRGFSPMLDRIAIKAPLGEAGVSDPPVERPKSAAGIGAVSRPRSAGASGGLPQDVLPNGMPALPADLSLDGPAANPLQGQDEGRGRMPSSFAGQLGSHHSEMSPVAFPGVLFSLPGQQASSMWQQFGQPSAGTAAQQSLGSPSPAPAQQQQQQQEAPVQHLSQDSAFNLEAAKQSFYHAAEQSLSSSAFSTGISASPLSVPQFGTFNSQFGGTQGGPPGLQFGQLQTGFGAFVPTGKQPDWSTGKQPDWSTGPLGAGPQSSSTPAFSRSVGLDTMLPHILPYASHQGTSESEQSRNGGLPHSNGDYQQQGLPEDVRLPADLIGKAAEDTAAAGLPDDVFGPDEAQRHADAKMQQHMRGGGMGGRRGGDGGGRRGRAGNAQMRGMAPGGRGFGRGRGREHMADGQGGAEGGQRRRDAIAGGQPRMHPAPQQRRHPGEAMGANGPADAGSRNMNMWDGGRGRGDMGRGGRIVSRGGRGAARGTQAAVTTWVPVPQAQGA